VATASSGKASASVRGIDRRANAVRVAAVNSAGLGAFSNIATLPA
jgi:hypothetical protein